MKTRLKEIRLESELSQAKFARRIGIPQSTYAMFETGDRELKDIHIKQICSEFNINEVWLRTSKGDMYAETTEGILAELTKEFDLDELDQKIILEYAKLNTEQKNVIKEYINSVIKNNEIAPVEEKELEKPTPKTKTKEPDHNEHINVECDDPEIRKELEDYGKELIDAKKGKMSPELLPL